MDEKIFEEKIEETTRRFEERLKDFEERLEEKFDTKYWEHRRWTHSRRSGEFWGIVLLIVGFIFMAENMHWFHWDFPLIPTAMIVVGIYLLFRSFNRD
jgi:hypothetical protein